MFSARSGIRAALIVPAALSPLFGVVGGCSGDEEEQLQHAKLAQGCTLNSQCEEPLVCTFALCHRQCDRDRDCPGEERCVKGNAGHVCQLPANTSCDGDGDCSGNQVCGVDGECRDECTSNGDCARDQVCANGGQCASTIDDKDVVDDKGDIKPDPFDDTRDGSAGSGGASGASGTAGTSGTAGSAGNAGSSGTAGASGSGGTGPGGTAGTGGAAGMPDGSTGTGGSGTGGTETGDASTDGGDADAGCATGHAECDGNPNTVCEADLSLPTSCGGCTTSCNPQHGNVHCDVAAGYKCVVDTCNAGYDNCDNDGANGCETLLTEDPRHCGGCGRNCGGAACTNGVCGAAVVMDPRGPGTTSGLYEIQLFGNRVVASIVIGSTYDLRSVILPPTNPPSEGTVLHQFSIGTDRQVGTLVVDASYIYWATNAVPYTVYRKPLDNPSANIESMFTGANGGSINQMVASGNAFYFFGSGPAGYGFSTAARAPGSSAQRISGLGGLYSSQSLVGGFVVAGNRIFWAAGNAGQQQYLTAPAGGGTPETVDTTIQSSTYVGAVSDGTYVYWNTVAANGSIRRAAIATPTTAQDVALQVNSPNTGLAVDGTYVYFSDGQNGIWRAKKDGSELKQRLASPSGTQYMTKIYGVDADYLYGAGTGGEVVRIRNKP